MTYTITEPLAGVQPIDSTDTTQRHPVGFVVSAVDPTYGGGEFVYLKGVTSTVVGNVVTYHPSTGQTTIVPNTANLGQPVAVAMAANTTNLWGWYQVGGIAVVKKTAVAVAPNSAMHISGTAGRLMPTAASGKQILGARSANVASVTTTTSTVLVSINRPHAQGRTS